MADTGKSDEAGKSNSGAADSDNKGAGLGPDISPRSVEEAITAKLQALASDQSDEEDGNLMEKLSQFFSRSATIDKKTPEPVEKVLAATTFDAVADYILSGKCKKIVAMVGAGISTSAGIPDFRSPSSGLYANLGKYNLPSPESMFDISFFRHTPEPFFQLAKELFPGKFIPTPCHFFLRLLHEKGLLQRIYTQNIDTLERVAGIPDDKIVEAHGSFHKSHCLDRSCNSEYSLEWMREKIFKDTVPTCEKCNTCVKPDIVFFGERLPSRFFELSEKDFAECDLLIVIGTSLTVQPFASLVDNVSSRTPRILINMTKCGLQSRYAQLLGLGGGGLKYDDEDNYRDVMCQGLCDEKCIEFAEKLKWKEDLDKLISSLEAGK